MNLNRPDLGIRTRSTLAFAAMGNVSKGGGEPRMRNFFYFTSTLSPFFVEVGQLLSSEAAEDVSRVEVARPERATEVHSVREMLFNHSLFEIVAEKGREHWSR